MIVASRFRRTIAAALVLPIILALAACSTPAPPDTDPSIRGTISSVTGSSILIEGTLEPDTSFDKASVAITDETEVFDERGTRVSAVDLSAGLTVEAWFTGAVAESYPVQATASAIRILDE